MFPAFLGSPLRLSEKQTFIPVKKTTLLQTEWQCLINGQYFQWLRQLTNRTPYSSMATMQIKLQSRAAHQPAIFTRYPLAGHVWGFHFATMQVLWCSPRGSSRAGCHWAAGSSSPSPRTVRRSAFRRHLSAAAPTEPPRTCRLMGAVILWGKELQLDNLPKKTTNIERIYAKH